MAQAKKRSAAVARCTAARPKPSRRRARVAVVFVCAGLAAGIWSWRAAARRAQAPAPPSSAVTAPSAVTDVEEQRILGVASRQPADPAPRLELARYYVEQRRPAEAVWEYQEAAALRPGDVRLQAAAADAWGGLHLHDVAIERLAALVAGQPHDGDARRRLAEQFLATGRAEQAVALLGLDARQPDVSLEALSTLGQANLVVGDLGAAERAFDERERRSPGDIDGFYWSARVGLASGRVPVARQALERAAEAAPTDPRHPYSLGMTYARGSSRESVDRAGAAFDEALRRDPQFVPALVQLGLLFQRHQRYREAARHFLRAVEIAPRDPEPHRHLAVCLDRLGEPAEAHRHRGLSYSLDDQPARALAEYEKLQALLPDSIDAPLLLSQSYIRMQQNERAAAVIERALERHLRHGALRERLAELYILTHSRKEATQVCREWLRDDPDAARAYWLLGRIALGSHQPDVATREFEAALSRDPEDAEFHFALGGVLDQPTATPETRSRALTLLRRAVELKPSSPAYRYRLAIALRQSGDPEAARRELLATLDQDPGHAAAYNALVQVAQALRRPHQIPLWARAMRVVQDRRREEKRLRREAGARPRDPAVYFALAQALLRAGDVAGAEGQLEQALQLQPRWVEARRLLGRVTALRAVL